MTYPARRLRSSRHAIARCGLGRLPADGRDVPAARSGPRLVEACGIGPGMRVLDVAAGTGNASMPAARRGADVTASDLTPALLEAGREQRRGRGPRARLGRGRRREPAVRGRVVRRRHVRDRRDVRAAPPGRRGRARARLPAGRHDRAAELDARGHARRALPHDEAVRAAAPARRAAPAAVGQRGAPARAARRPRRARTRSSATCSRSPRSSARTTTASTSRRTTGRRSRRVRTPSARGGQAEFDAALDAFCDEWNRGTPDAARFEKEYLVAVGTKV